MTCWTKTNRQASRPKNAQFEIRIDGTPRSYRDRKGYSMEAARLIKSKSPHSVIEFKDLQSGDVTAVALRPGERCPSS
jgi:hypothetical protein